MATVESAGSVVHEVTVNLDDGKSPEAWAGLKPPGQVQNNPPCIHVFVALASHWSLPRDGCTLVLCWHNSKCMGLALQQ